VPAGRVAWHAGISRFNGRMYLNRSFIGIVFLIDDAPDYGSFLKRIQQPSAYTDVMYNKAAWICKEIMAQYPAITIDRITMHSSVSGADVRTDPKHDPGRGFSLTRLKNMLRGDIDRRNVQPVFLNYPPH